MYLYETHCHTAQASKCACAKAADYISFYKKLGYSGIFITDHFFNGNTCVDPSIPWEQRVEEFCKGYENAKAEGEKQGLDVFFGFEYSYGWCHLLTYGLDKQWLLNNPGVLEWDVITYLDRVRKDGGMVVHAHPFRDGIDKVTIFPDHIDAVEVYNASQSEEANRRANLYAQMLFLPKVSGSDIHNLKKFALGAVATKEKLTCVGDYIKAVKEKRIEIIKKTAED